MGTAVEDVSGGSDGDCMTDKEKVAWFNIRRVFIADWRVGQDVFCFHCDGKFKAEKIAEDRDGDPCCPFCGATPLDLAAVPWWKSDADCLSNFLGNDGNNLN